MKIMVKLNELRFELLGYPPYSPDLAPSDDFVFEVIEVTFPGENLAHI